MDNEAGRIYGQSVPLDYDAVQSFWDKKASGADVRAGGTDAEILKSVLLGSDLAKQSGVIRNERELRIVRGFINLKDKTVLDIGCGIGRWAHNLKSEVRLYHGVDFSQEFISKAQEIFNEYNHINFFCMSAVDLDLPRLLTHYDLIIITGVAMYINDEEIAQLFESCCTLSAKNSSIYFQESVSVMGRRLTLKDFNSKELNANYNAIYRTPNEYEALFSRCLHGFEFARNTAAQEGVNLLLDKETGARDETNAAYWFLTKQKE